MKPEAGLFQGFVLAPALYSPYINDASAVFGFRVAVFVYAACPYALPHCLYPTGLETKDKPTSYCCSWRFCEPNPGYPVVHFIFCTLLWLSYLSSKTRITWEDLQRGSKVKGKYFGRWSYQSFLDREFIWTRVQFSMVTAHSAVWICKYKRILNGLNDKKIKKKTLYRPGGFRSYGLSDVKPSTL
jgi:hypothetical protein